MTVGQLSSIQNNGNGRTIEKGHDAADDQVAPAHSVTQSHRFLCTAMHIHPDLPCKYTPLIFDVHQHRKTPSLTHLLALLHNPE